MPAAGPIRGRFPAQHIGLGRSRTGAFCIRAWRGVTVKLVIGKRKFSRKSVLSFPPEIGETTAAFSLTSICEQSARIWKGSHFKAA